MESTRDQLRRRPDVAPDEVDDIVALAAELQDADRAAHGGPTRDELDAVARELDIDPKFVGEALTAHARRKAERATAAAAAAAAAEASRKARTRLLGAVGGGLAAVAVVVGLGLGGLGWSAGSRIEAARIEEHRAEQALITALDRQEALAPQLVALAGGTFEAPDPTPADAPIEVQLSAAERLGTDLAKALSALPPAADEAAGQQRLNLQYELTGSQNRISVERQRWQDARAAVEQVDRGLGASVAHALGW